MPSPFPYCPVVRECLRKKTQIEKKSMAIQKFVPLRNSLKKECYPSSIVPPSSSVTFIIGNQYFDRYSVSFEDSLPVQNSEDLKSVIASCISLLVRDLAMRRSFGNKSPFLCEHPFNLFTIHLSQDCSR